MNTMYAGQTMMREFMMQGGSSDTYSVTVDAILKDMAKYVEKNSGRNPNVFFEKFDSYKGRQF